MRGRHGLAGKVSRRLCGHTPKHPERERETALQRDPKAKTKKVTYGDLEGRWWTRDWDGKVNGAPKRLSLKKGFTRDTGRWPRVSGETVAG